LLLLLLLFVDERLMLRTKLLAAMKR